MKYTQENYEILGKPFQSEGGLKGDLSVILQATLVRDGVVKTYEVEAPWHGSESETLYEFRASKSDVSLWELFDRE
jgi:hypothetical protein